MCFLTLGAMNPRWNYKLRARPTKSPKSLSVRNYIVTRASGGNPVVVVVVAGKKGYLGLV